MDDLDSQPLMNNDMPATILVVDDMPANLDIMLHFLEQEGYRIIIAVNGQEALERAELAQPDLILLDIMMPELNGFEVCQQLKAKHSTEHIPVIFMTALTEIKDRVKGFTSGAVDYICKPFQLEEVVMRINTHLTLRKTEKQLDYHNHQLKQEMALRTTQSSILELIATNTPLPQVLTELVKMIEPLSDNMTATICLLDKTQHSIDQCIAPSLPISYSQDLCGIKIGPEMGSCGTAMYNRQQVIVEDLTTHPFWDNWRDMVAPYGFKACWSNPLFAADGQILGAFAMYYSEIKHPQKSDLRLIELASRLAVIALEKERNQQTIEHMAHYDILTNLPNRILLKDRLSQAIMYAQRHQTSLAVLFVDLDGFKHVNDSYGHHVGDQLLQVVSASLSHCLRATDIVSRWGGDEFIVVLQGIAIPSQLVLAVDKISSVLTAKVKLDDQTIETTSSIGISLYPRDGENSEELLRSADLAMYKAKAANRGSYHFFQPELNQAFSRRVAIINHLDQAIHNNELELYYQPQLNLITESIDGVECFIHWHHPTLGTLTQEELTSIFEETERGISLGDWALKTACKQAKNWQTEGIPPFRIAINLFSNQLKSKSGLLTSLKTALAAANLDAQWIDLGFTEAAIDNSERRLSLLYDLRELGVQLTLNHFGSRDASLLFLMQVPIDCLKTHPHAVGDIATSKQNQALIKSIINLSNHLQIRYLANGVDTPEKLELLTSLACEDVQGYHISKPLSAQELPLWVAEKSLW